MKPRHWISLVDSLRHGQCVLVLGPEIEADVSASPGRTEGQAPVTYADALKENLADVLREEHNYLLAPGSLAGVAQIYEDAPGFGASALRSQAAQFYASQHLEPSKYHEALASLPFPLIVTTCHDRLLTDALTHAGKTPLVHRYNLRGDRRDNVEVPLPTVEAPVVYHLFGTFEEAQTLVLSENDLLDFLVAMASDRPPIPNGLRGRLQREGVSLLFVGFGIRHWYQRVLLKALIRSMAGVPSRISGAVALEPLLQTIPDTERRQTILFYQRGTRVEVSDETILSFVGELQTRLEEAGGVAREASAVGPRVRVFVSYAKEDGALAGALFTALREAELDPWLDAEGLRHGENWDRAIQEELKEVDFVLLLVTPQLVRKTVGYVNVEIEAALQRAKYYRGTPFLIPLMSDRLQPGERIPELRDLNEMTFREAHLRDDIADLAKQLRRDVQRRNR